MTWAPVEPLWPLLYLPDPPGHAGLSATATLVDDLAPATATMSADDPLICYCFAVPESTIRRAILAHEMHDVAEITALTRAGGGCGSCHPDLEDELRYVWGEVAKKGYVVLCHEWGVTPGGVGMPTASDDAAAAFEAMPALARLAKITDVLNREIRPLLQGDGGDLSLIDVDGNRVIVNLVGACSSCSASSLTLRGLVEERLRQYVSPQLEVIAV